MTHACTRQDIKTCRKTLSRELKKARTEKERKYRKRLWAVKNVGRYKIEYVAEQVGVVVRTVYRWLKRYREEGKEGLKDKSKRPHTIHKVSDEIVKKVIELRIKYGYGAEKIGIGVGIAPATANKILNKAKLSTPKKIKKRIKHYERKYSNALWHIDYTMLHDGLWLLLVIDDHSRFIVAFKLMKTPNVKAPLNTLKQAFEKYGVPREIITDYGSRFYAVRGGVSTFDIFCLQNEIKHILERVKHPETNGKVERKMKEVKEFLASINYTPANMSADELKKR